MAPKSTKSAKQIKKQSDASEGKRNFVKKKSKYFTSLPKNKLKEIKKRLESENVPDGGATEVHTPNLPPLVEQTSFINKDNPVEYKNRLGRGFFDRPTEILAVALLGKLLCRVTDKGEVLSGRIVETEAYLGEVDAACHSYGGRRTPRNEPMFGLPGTSYVYFIYGMYHCFNISSQEKGACVLIRALEPVQGLDCMRMLRHQKRKQGSKSLKDHELTNGPSKLCNAMNINKDQNNLDLVKSENFYIEDDTSATAIPVVHATRIGIESYGKESANKLYRYYILGNRCVSVRDKIVEKELVGVNNKLRN